MVAPRTSGIQHWQISCQMLHDSIYKQQHNPSQHRQTYPQTHSSEIFTLQYYLLTNQNVPDAEIIQTIFFDGVTPANGFWCTMPFSRGSVHIASNKPAADPIINLNFFLSELRCGNGRCAFEVHENILGDFPSGGGGCRDYTRLRHSPVECNGWIVGQLAAAIE